MEDNKTDCKCVDTSKEGKYRSVGLLPIQSPAALIALSFLHCKYCGNVIVREVKMRGLGTPPPGLAVPDLSRMMKK